MDFPIMLATALALLVLCLVGPRLGVWPIIRPGDRARNNALLAFMDPPTARKYQRRDAERQSYLGVTGQEAADVVGMQIVGALVMAVVGFWAGPMLQQALEPRQGVWGAAALQVAATVLGWILISFLRLWAFRAYFDRLGHAVELRLGMLDPALTIDLGMTANAYLRFEVTRMRRDDLHDHWSVVNLERHMRALVDSWQCRFLAWLVRPRARRHVASKRSV